MPVTRGGISISYIFFVDDNILIYKTTREEWCWVKSLVKTYENGSGQVINNQKSSIYFSSNTSTNAKQEVIQEVGGSTYGSYDKYLGLQAMIGKSKYNCFRWIKERVWQKVSNWKQKFLSQARREVLIKAVLQVLLV